jgi:hypothetical protein
MTAPPCALLNHEGLAVAEQKLEQGQVMSDEEAVGQRAA